MFSLWFLSAAVLAVLTYCFRRTQRVRKLKHSDTEPSVPELTTGIVGIPEREGEQGRIMRWISIGEFEAVLKECSDLIVIDLRAEAKSTPFPVPVPLVLPVAPNDLFEVLDCLPPDKSVAFCGASNLSIFLISTSPCMEGSAPLYVLEGDLGFAEVA